VVILGSVFWSLLAFALLGGLLWPVTRFGILYIVEQRGRIYDVAAEGLLGAGLLLAGLISFAMYSYATRVMENALRVERKENRSLGQALWTHVLFGMGIFYVDPPASRKWLYPLFAIAIPLIILLGPLTVGAAHTAISGWDEKLLGIYVGQEEKADIIWALGPYRSWLRVILGVALAGYLLSYVDVIATFYRPPQPERRAQPAQWSEQIEWLRKFLQAINVHYGNLRRWLDSRTLLQKFGLATIAAVVLFALGIVIFMTPLATPLGVPVVWLLFAAIIAWLVLALLVIFQNAWKLITWVSAKAKKSGSASQTEEPSLVSDSPADPPLKP
jgi:hypothetical protein